MTILRAFICHKARKFEGNFEGVYFQICKDVVCRLEHYLWVILCQVDWVVFGFACWYYGIVFKGVSREDVEEWRESWISFIERSWNTSVVQVIEDLFLLHCLDHSWRERREELRGFRSRYKGGIGILVLKLWPPESICVICDQDVKQLYTLANTHDWEVISIVIMFKGIVKYLLSCDSVRVQLVGDWIWKV